MAAHTFNPGLGFEHASAGWGVGWGTQTSERVLPSRHENDAHILLLEATRESFQVFSLSYSVVSVVTLQHWVAEILVMTCIHHAWTWQISIHDMSRLPCNTI